MMSELLIADRQLAYQRQVGRADQPGILFLSGFASDMTGSKAQFLADRCKEHDISFVRFDYSGCGQSSGKFTDGTLGLWREDSLAVFDRLTTGPQIVVGSSMGGWLALLLAKARPERLAGVVLLAPAPDFTEDLIWAKLTDAQRETLKRDGQVFVPPDDRVPFTLKLIEEGRQHFVMRSPLPVPCPVRLLQGMIDREVPADYAQRIATHIQQDDVRVTLIKNGDHRLSNPQDLELLWQTVAAFFKPPLCIRPVPSSGPSDRLDAN